MGRSARIFPSFLRHILLFIVLALLLGGLVVICPVTVPEVLASGEALTVDRDWGQMPLYFIANEGQLEEAVGYYVQGSDKTLYFTDEGLTFLLAASETDGGWTAKLTYLGAREVSPQGRDKTDATISYFQGAEEDWSTGIPTYSSIVYPDLWTGIDLAYSGRQDQLKQEFILEPGADSSDIRLSYQGATLRLTSEGDLEVSTPAGGFIDEAPVAYQVVDGERAYIPVAYSLDVSTGAGAQETTAYGFSVGEYDHTLPLVIDPAALVYCGYIGGSGFEEAFGVAVDSSGCAYVTGYTSSAASTFPETTGSFDTSQNGSYDAFVAKVAADGSALAYCTYLGGSSDDYGFGIAVDSSGCAYISGKTSSTESGTPAFPVTSGSYDETQNGAEDAFVAKINAAGNALIYCTYLGGSDSDEAWGIAIDSSSCAYVTGYTYSTEATFPKSVGPKLTHSGVWDAFVAKVNADGDALIYCGFVGGASSDYGKDVAVDSSGCAYITGYTNSNAVTAPVFPVTGDLDATHNGNTDAFVAKVAANGGSFVYCGYIGGNLSDWGNGITVDSSGSAYVTGYTQSTESTFPETAESFDASHNGSTDGFLAKVNAAGSELTYCGYIGGSESDYGSDVAVDSSGCAYVAGYANSDQSTFPVVGDIDSIHNGGLDAFVAKVNADGDSFIYNGYIGGVSSDAAYAVAVDSQGCAYVVGNTYSTEATFPVVGDLDSTYNNNGDAFVAKVRKESPPTVTDVSPGTGSTAGGTEVTITGTGFEAAYSVYFGGVAPSGGFEVISDTEMVAVTPPHAAGTVQVQVTNAYGSSEDTVDDNFDYIIPGTRIQQDTPGLGYVRAWSTLVNANASGGSSWECSSGGSNCSIKFTGDYLGWVARTSAGQGKARVTLDYGEPVTVDLYSATPAWQQTVWETPGDLEWGTHQVFIEYTATRNPSAIGWGINVDAFDMTGGLLQAPLRYQHNRGIVRYSGPTGTWVTNWNNYASYLSFKRSNTAGSTFKVNFTGSHIAWIGLKAPAYGKASITLDGAYKGTVSLYAPTQEWERKIWEGSTTYGEHTLIVTVTGTKQVASSGYYVDADAFDIQGWED